MPLDRQSALYLKVIRTQPFFLGHPVQFEHVQDDLARTDRDSQLLANDELIRRHIAVLGLSGAGKSKLVEAFCRHLIDTGNGFTFIDPHGDTAQAVADYAASVAHNKGDSYILPRFHYLRPSLNWLFSLNPFPPLRVAQYPDADPDFAFESLRDAAAAAMAEVLLRRYAEQEKEIMRRLMRWLENALLLIATPREDGRHLTFADIGVALQPQHPDHPRILAAVNSCLPEDVQVDYEFFHSLQRAIDQDHYIESSINNIRAFLKTVPQAMFGSAQPSIDFEQVVRNREIVVVNLKSTEYFSERAAMAVADFIIHRIKSACAKFDEQDDRTEHHLIIDEASQYLAEDLGHFLERTRKWKLSLCLISQGLSNFDRGNVEVSKALLNHCKLFLSFQQRELDEVRLLGKFFAYPNYNLRELTTRKQTADPSADRVVALEDRAATKGVQRAHSDIAARTAGGGASLGDSDSRSTGSAEGDGASAGQFESLSSGMSPMILDGQIIHLPVAGAHGGTSLVRQRSNNQFQSQSQANFRSTSTFDAATLGTADTIGESSAESVTIKHTLVPGTREVWDATGQPRYAIPYQDAMHEYLLTVLPDRYALCRTKINNVEQTILFQTPEVASPYENAQVAAAERETFLANLYASKPYMFRPESIRAASEKRRAAFLSSDDRTASGKPVGGTNSPPAGFE